MSPEAITTGFIGLGSQGGPMAQRMMEAGFPLTLWARREASFDAFRDTAAVFAGSIAELGAACDHVAVCVVDDAGVAEVCGELLPAMRPGARLVIHPTVHPDTCRRVAADAAARAVAVLDAPVSGGGAGAADRTLTVMVGGDATVLDAARPVLESFAGLIVHLGDIGSGQTAKLVNNALMAANFATAFEALAAGEALGIDRAALAGLIGASSGRSYAVEVASRLPAPRAFGHGARLLAKDVGLLRGLVGGRGSIAAIDAATGPFLAAALEGPVGDELDPAA